MMYTLVVAMTSLMVVAKAVLVCLITANEYFCEGVPVQCEGCQFAHDLE